MSIISAQLSDPVSWLVLAGGGLQATAHLFKNQIVLRLVLLAGTLHYIAYYFAASAQPLWPAIMATATLAIGAVIGLYRALTSPPKVTCNCLILSEANENVCNDHEVLRVVKK